jgi:hypothetical protein
VAKRKVLADMSGRAVIPQGSDIDPESVTIMPDGRAFSRTVFGLTDEQVEKIRQGYICVKCLEEYTSPFPDECSVCRFPMRERQGEEFAKDYRGEVRFGPSTTLDEERGIMNEMREQATRERALRLGLSIPKPSIIIPRDL